MNQDQWTAVDEYIGRTLLPTDATLKAALETNAKAGLPAIDVSPPQGRLLYLLAKIHGARRILEIGTLGGYSTICLARALPPDGELVTLELEQKHADIAQKNLERAGLSHKVRIMVGPAIESLGNLIRAKTAPFDLVFIDADKPSTTAYYQKALGLSRPGTVIIADNVVRKGELANPESQDPNVLGMRQFTEILGKDKRVEATAVQTVGSKGYDGFVIARVVE